MKELIFTVLLLSNWQLTKAQSNKSGLSTFNRTLLDKYLNEEVAYHRRVLRKKTIKLKQDTLLNQLADFQVLFIVNNDIEITHDEIGCEEYETAWQRFSLVKEGMLQAHRFKGEIINRIPVNTSYTTKKIAKGIIQSFKSSPPHWKILMGDEATHIGWYSRLNDEGQLVTVMILSEEQEDVVQQQKPNLDSLALCEQLVIGCEQLRLQATTKDEYGDWIDLNKLEELNPSCLELEEEGGILLDY